MKKLHLVLLCSAVLLGISGCTSLSHWFNSLGENTNVDVPLTTAENQKDSASTQKNTASKSVDKKINTPKNQPGKSTVEKTTAIPKPESAEKKAFNSQFSGWLVDYTTMKETSTPTGGTSLLWVSSELKKKKYTAIMIDPVGLYPRPPLLAKVSKGRMLEALTYMREQTKKAVGKEIKIVDQPGPNVLRLDAAITGVKIAPNNDKRHDAKNTPVAMIFVDASPLAAKQNQDTVVYLEARLRDSRSNKILAKAVRAAVGNSAGNTKVTVDQMKPVMDSWAHDAAIFIRDNVK